MPDKRIPGIGHALLFAIMFHSLVLSFMVSFFFIDGIVSDSSDVLDSVSEWMETLTGLLAFALVLIIGKAWARRPWWIGPRLAAEHNSPSKVFHLGGSAIRSIGFQLPPVASDCIFRRSCK